MRADVLILGVPRAGTTLLANLLSTPPGRWVMVEPGVTRQGMNEAVLRQAQEFGFAIGKPEWFLEGDGESPESRFDRALAPRLCTLDRWGIKEVNPQGWERLIEKFEPVQVLLAVRDIGAASISGWRKLATRRRPDQDDQWLFDRMTSSAAAVVRLADWLPRQSTRIVRYEDFAQHPQSRESLAAWLDWPLDGDPSRGLESFGREAEVALHRGAITALSLERDRRSDPPDLLEFAERVERACAEYQSRFNYARRAV